MYCCEYIQTPQLVACHFLKKTSLNSILSFKEDQHYEHNISLGLGGKKIQETRLTVIEFFWILLERSVARLHSSASHEIHIKYSEIYLVLMQYLTLGERITANKIVQVLSIIIGV